MSVAFLTRGNTKLGPLVKSWSIPALKTCPGASALCKKLCYARRGHYVWESAQRALRRNLRLAKSKNFVPTILSELREQSVRICRIHAAGDFFDAEYIRKWQKIVQRRQNVTFYAYTRSWHEAELLPALQALADEPNMHLWFSWDATMPQPPVHPGVRTCYLSNGDQDLPENKVDLVFRNHPKSVMKRTPAGALVCPFENGVTALTCSRCQFCWTPKKKRRRSRVSLPRTVRRGFERRAHRRQRTSCY